MPPDWNASQIPEPEGRKQHNTYPFPCDRSNAEGQIHNTDDDATEGIRRLLEDLGNHHGNTDLESEGTTVEYSFQLTVCRTYRPREQSPIIE
jgi:hypothetical protein